jgi:hypothetical protein
VTGDAASAERWVALDTFHADGVEGVPAVTVGKGAVLPGDHPLVILDGARGTLFQLLPVDKGPDPGSVVG